MALTPSQQEACEHFKGPALTLAIPGSGKTTLLLHRLIHLTKHHQVDPSAILTLTFSKASANDMQARYDAKFAEEYPYKYTFMTIHKFAYGIYRKYLKGIGKEMTLLDDGHKKYQILSQIYKKHENGILSEEDFETLTNEIGLLYNLMLKKNDPSPVAFTWESLFDMATDYHSYKKSHQLFDFDDMLMDAIKILEKNEAWLMTLRSQYPFIQVDEAQDTSKLQYALIELLLGHDKNLFIVADDDQSIYGFRGAYPDYLLNFTQHFQGAKMYQLKENFRSDANIVHTASQIIKQNEKRYDKEMCPTKPAEHNPSVKVFSNLYDRNAYLIQNLNDSQNKSAILYRNKVSALSLADALIRAEVPFNIKEAPLQELKHWILQDLLAFFTLAMIPQDLESFLKIAYKMNGFISKEMRQYVMSNHRGRNIFDVLIEIPFLEDYQTRTQERLKNDFETLATLRPFDAIHFIETELGYLDYIKNNGKRLGVTMNFSRTRLDAYKAIASSLKSGFDFIHRIDALSNAFALAYMDTHAKVTLSTLHGSKGLEFHKVYMIDVNPQIFPGFNVPSIEEERRLFYVGITRAESQFELLHCEFINGAYNKGSQFVEELLSQPLTDNLFHTVTGKSAI